MRLSTRLYRRLVKLYPAGFRESYSGPLEQQFREDYAEARGSAARAALWLRTLADFARSMPAQAAHELAQDSRYAFRTWRRHPLHTTFAIAVLAIAIGANTGIFSVLNAVLLRSLPFHEPERLARLQAFLPPGGPPDAARFHQWRTQSTYLSDSARYVTGEVSLEGDRGVSRTRLTEVSSNFFALFGREPIAGRGFAPGEDAPGGPGIAVISHGLWRRLFALDPRAVGASIRLNGTPLTIVGVAPPNFDYPQKTDIWTPTAFDYPRVPKTYIAFYFATARLRPGVTWAQANSAFEAEAYALLPHLRKAADSRNRPALVPLSEELAGPIRAASLLLMTGVGLLLLLACANVANFFLARALSRADELRVRTALGASRARLAQQLLTEAVLLSFIAAVLGLAVAHWTTIVAMTYQPVQSISQAYTIFDWRVLCFAIAAATATGLLFGAGPALYISRADLALGSRASTAGRRHSNARAILVGTQVAVAVVLLTGSLGLGRTFRALLHTDNGYELRSLATMTVSFAGTGYMSDERWRVYYDDVVRTVRAVPDVLSVSATGALPLAIEAYQGAMFTLDGSGPTTFTSTIAITPDYLRTMGVRLLAGRDLTADDLTSGEAVAVVNEQLARAFGEPSTVIGRSLTATVGRPRRIVGVVTGMRDGGPTSRAHPQAFLPARSMRSLTIVAKVKGDAASRIAVIRDAVAGVDAKIPVFDVKTMDQRLDDTLARPRFYMTSVVFFGGLALLLSIAGVYGVVSYACGERIREMGIRLALGSTPGRLRGRLLVRTLITVGLGAIAGITAAAASASQLQHLIKGAEQHTFATSALAVLGTILVASAATWIATQRVARLDVTDVLRGN
jgi:predicted permease